jgi:hypothetical protein
MDKADANPDRVLQQISEHGLVPEKWGGDTICVEISALQGTGIDELLEQVLLVAEVAELTARPAGRAVGTVLEANLEVGRAARGHRDGAKGTALGGRPRGRRRRLRQGQGPDQRSGQADQEGRPFDAGPDPRLQRAAVRRRRDARRARPGARPLAGRGPRPTCASDRLPAGRVHERRPTRGPLRADPARRDRDA